MGNFFKRKAPSTPLSTIEEEKRTPEELRDLEKAYDKYDEDCLLQRSVMQKYLRIDEMKYAEDVKNYRNTNKVYVIDDRDFIRRAEDIRMRQNIKW